MLDSQAAAGSVHCLIATAFVLETIDSLLYAEKDVKVRILDGQSSHKLWMFYHSLPCLAHGDAMCFGRNGKEFPLWIGNSFDLLVI
jgi:hypothetical protein